MPEDHFSFSKERKIPPATVNLREDASPVKKKLNFSGRPKLVWSNLKNSQKIIAVGTAFLSLLIIGAGIYAVMGGDNDDIDGNEEERYGLLPETEDAEIAEEVLPVSGLSGMHCEEYDRRPIGVMLASDPIARPVSGFAKADMVWELPALVSNVTRHLAVYQCGRPEEIGSVRSVRHDYLFLAEGIDAIVGHWGGSYHALNRIRVGEFQTISALSNPHNAFFRKTTQRAPYNGFTTYDRMWNALTGLGHRTTTEFEGYDFKDDIVQAERPAGGTLSIAWPGQYRVHYEYNPENNRYYRYWGGVAQTDGEDGSPVSPSTVIIMRATNRPAPGPGGYNDVGIEGEGRLKVYQDGQEIIGTWRKDPLNKKDPVHFLNEHGDPIVLTRGQVWIMAVDPAVSVTWEALESSSEN